MKKFFPALLFAMTCLVWSAACSSDGGEDGTDPAPVVEGTFRLHSFLQNGMVIQQNQPFTLWGVSKAGVKITASPSWTNETYSCIVPKNTRWTLDVPVPAAPSDNAPQSITISTTIHSETLSDLLIGEVWLLGGQSNMTFWMNQVRDKETEIAAADYPEIRFYTVWSDYKTTPQYDWRSDQIDPTYYKWYKCTPQTAGSQSAVGYYFGRMLHEELGVPVGLVNTATGGATAQAYTPIEALEADPVLKANFVDPLVNHSNALVRPAEYYNMMVHPLLPLSIRGIAWYQGEGNWDRYDLYPRLMETLIGSWRRNFDRGTLPFYYVQIAPYCIMLGPGSTVDIDDPAVFYQQGDAVKYAYMREAQALTREEVPATGMALTMDVGDPKDIHPIDKRPVGERLARLALNGTYGRTEIACLGPRYKGHTVENGVVKVAFDHAEGLKTRDAKAPVHFYVASSSGEHKFHPAAAEIHGSEVWLTCPAVVGAATAAADVEIRYAFLLYPVTNLENGEGLPAEPFRTDDWGPFEISYAY